jgi:hypothetical protein
MTTDIIIQQPTIGFGSYLSSILPPDIATACGALSSSFRQVKNISNIPTEKFAQVVTNLETIVGLPVNGTNVPANLDLRTAGRPLIALGSGPQGTYTASDFFGCMSGLPYNGPLKNILAKLKSVATTKLFTIYQQLYLAVTWEPATFAVTTTQQAVETSPGSGLYDWQYKITGTTFVSQGGGYTRSGAAAPGGSYTFSDGSPASSGGVLLTTNPDTDDSHVPGTYGRMINLQLTGTATWVTYASSQPSASPTSPGLQYRLPAPPNTYVAYPYTGGSNSAYGTTGWPGMNSVIQSLIDDANAEIDSINRSKRLDCQSLNDSWNATGAQLTIEQRARQIGLKPPLADPRDNYMSLFPSSIYNFVDAMGQYAKNTEPHMYAQTIENISNLQTPGGQSAVASMRQQRNQDRLTLLGVPLDNNISDKLPYEQQKVLIANGRLPTGTTNPNIPSGSTTANTTGTTSTTGTEVLTPIATANQTDVNGEEITATPIGVYDPVSDTYLTTDPNFGGQNPPAPLDNGAAFIPNVTGVVGTGTNTGTNNSNTTGVGTAGAGSGINGVTTGTIGINGAVINGIGTPGSFAGSPYTNLIPPELNTWYTSNTLYPSTYTVSQAIEEVVLCNCDCWQLA